VNECDDAGQVEAVMVDVRRAEKRRLRRDGFGEAFAVMRDGVNEWTLRKELARMIRLMGTIDIMFCKVEVEVEDDAMSSLWMDRSRHLMVGNCYF
jgi:hypothetical protein